MSAKFSIVIPAYNEDEYIGILLSDIQEEFQTLNNLEVIVVDDGSKVLLSKVVSSDDYNFQLKIIRNTFNLGQTESIKKGVNEASAEIIGLIDADGQNPPSELKKLFDIFEAKNADGVIGYRQDRQDSKMKTVPSKIANYLFRLLTSSSIKDLGCSLKILKKEHLISLDLNGDMHRFIAPMLEKREVEILQIPTLHKSRTTGKTNYGLGRIIPVIVDSILFYLTKGFQGSSRYTLGKLSFYLTLSGIIALLISTFQKFALSIFIHRNPLFLISIFFFLMAIQIFMTTLKDN